MSTTFRLEFESRNPDIDLPRFRKSLPQEFEITQEVDGLYVVMPSDENEDENLQYRIDRELDRHFFLTSVKVKATMVRRHVTASCEIRSRIHGELPEDIGPQTWNYDLPIQLRLWALADESNNHLLKIILFYQIIELSRTTQQSPEKYTDASSAPSPLVECRFVRNLAVHSGDIRDRQLMTYCEYLGIPALMHDPTDAEFSNILKQKVPLLEQEARQVIQRSL